MNVFQTGRKTLKSFSDAHKFIRDNKLWIYVLLPGIVNLIFLVVTTYLGWVFAESLSESIMEAIGESDNSVLQWMQSALTFVISICIKILTFIIYSYIYKNLVLFIISPFMSLLIDKVDKIRTGKEDKFKLNQFIKDVVRGIVIAGRNLALEWIFVVIIGLLSFIPIVQFVTPVLFWIVTTYFFGFSMFDYTLEKKKYSLSESVQFIKKNRPAAIANGSVFYLLFLIPFVGWMVAPAYSVVASYMMYEQLEESTNSNE